ncbi:hypothetical protein DL766_008464 [Monosporascus sp. MC13-8B]|uniref:ELYS-like domain-containing protein n=1 Tax=Monosporascus cannonballus TaxID=155416 RepID=A0ABY0H721_9PEZI|nr:hypothetical protein DL762_006177 [Monosporascus cannonballus]RYO88948.1 hypothetical protein DL763_005808 [Monosporascus cannonballus]RYP19356.1 hypothetical protein DL766_008464 [Monosporascus sp. MC13-8B]
MLDYTKFHLVFGPLSPFPLDKPWAQSVESHRRNLDGALFLDRVLGALNLSQAAKNYPPKNESALRQLHQQVCEASNVAMHHKLSVLYYLLLDIDAHPKGRSQAPDRAEDFATKAAVPQKYSIFMKGLWLMDSAEFDLALEYLTHPSLVPDFADDIVVALARHSTKDGDYSLPLAYYHTVQPVLKTSLAQELLFDALARASVPEALAFARARPEFAHQQLFRRLVLIVLGFQGQQEGEEAATRAFELASLPLDEDEERWFTETLTGADGKRLKGAKDTLLMRRIARGDVPSTGEKGDWAVILEGFRAGSGGRA